jgi:hypothetical protein
VLVEVHQTDTNYKCKASVYCMDLVIIIIIIIKELNYFCVRTSSETHPASYGMSTGGHFPGDKEGPGSDAYQLPPSSAEIKNEQKLHLLSTLAPAWRSGTELALLQGSVICGTLSLTVFFYGASARFRAMASPNFFLHNRGFR